MSAELVQGHEAVRLYLKEMILSVLHNMLQFPKDCQVDIEIGPRSTVFYIDVRQEDFGRLMGTRGKNINALRTIALAIGATHGLRVVIQIKDEYRFF